MVNQSSSFSELEISNLLINNLQIEFKIRKNTTIKKINKFCDTKKINKFYFISYNCFLLLFI